MEPTARRLFGIALVFLLITSVTGTILRAYPFVPLPGIPYGNLLHAHSHTGFLGWVFLLLSGLGPLLLGPLAAFDLREHPAYNLSIYWYLHFQYNGWFVFFLLALGITWKSRQLSGWLPPRGSLPLLVGGIFLTYAISALWTSPTGVVNLFALLGSILQLAGAGLLLRSYRNAGGELSFADAIPRCLIQVALVSFLLKCLAQLASGLPALEPLTNHRFIVIAFLHLVFLAVVLPALLAVAWERVWIVDCRCTRLSLALLFSGVLLLLLALSAPVLLPGAPVFHRLPEILLLAALFKTLGIAGLFGKLRETTKD